MIGWGLGVRLAIDYPLAWNSQSVIMFAREREGSVVDERRTTKTRNGERDRERREREKDNEGCKVRVRDWEIELPVRSSQSRK